MRQYVLNEFPDKNGLVEIAEKDYRYFKQVLRLSTGDMVFLRLPDGKLQNSTVAKIDEKQKKVILQICSTEQKNAENQSDYKNKTQYFLFQFVAKGSKMELIFRQATECGVTKIIPVIGEFCEKGSSEKNFLSERNHKIIKEALQQSGSPVQTEIGRTLSLKEALNFWKEECADEEENCVAFVLWERNENTKFAHEALKQFNEIKKCAIFCGAEGGISEKEIDEMFKNKIIPVHFSTNILRCETAALYGIASFQTLIEEKQLWQQKL